MNFTKWSSLTLWMMLAALAASNVLLIKQNLQMRASLDKIKPKVLEAGNRVRAFSAQGLQGETLTVNYGGNGAKWILLYFTPV